MDRSIRPRIVDCATRPPRPSARDVGDRSAQLRSLRDAARIPIQVGALIRVLGVPALRDRFAAGRAQSLPVFHLLVGAHLRVHAIDEDQRLVELFFRIAWGPHAGMHFVLLEPWLVKVRSRRAILWR